MRRSKGRTLTKRTPTRLAVSTLVASAFVLLPLVALAAPRGNAETALHKPLTLVAESSPTGSSAERVSALDEADSVAKASTVPDGFTLINESDDWEMEGSVIIYEQRFRRGTWEEGNRASITITTVSGAFDAQHEFDAYPSARAAQINSSEAVISYTAPDDDGLIIIRWALTEDRNVLVVGRGDVDEQTLVALAESVAKEANR